MAVIKPKTTEGVRAEPVEREWPEKWQRMFVERKLTDPQQKPLEKVPFKFSYEYTCAAEGCRGHRMMNADWEISQPYRRMLDKHQSEAVAVERVLQRMRQMVGADREPYFYLGTVAQLGSWMILGVFWPPVLKS